jgi:hypothetical protein
LKRRCGWPILALKWIPLQNTRSPLSPARPVRHSLSEGSIPAGRRLPCYDGSGTQRDFSERDQPSIAERLASGAVIILGPAQCLLFSMLRAWRCITGSTSTRRKTCHARERATGAARLGRRDQVQLPDGYGRSAGKKVSKHNPFEGIITNFKRRFSAKPTAVVRDDLACYRSVQPH